MSQPLSFEERCERISLINPYIDILNNTKPKGTKEDPYILHCNKCGVTFNATSRTLDTSYLNRKNGKTPMDKYWCPACSGRRCFTGYNDIATVRPDLVKYFVSSDEATKITLGNNGKVWLKCPDCGATKLCNVYWFTKYGFNCDECSDGISYPNKICRALLKQLPINDYQFEYGDDWTDGKKYDAYFCYNSIKYLLEFDGSQHYVDSSWGTKEEQQIKDEHKDELANKNGFILIRINCFESDFDYIKQNILKSELVNIFDLSVINWKQCYKDSLKNIVIAVGEYYNNNEHPSIKGVSEEFHIHCDTAARYLKQATQIGICNYSPEISKMNGCSNSNIPFMDKSFYAYDPNGELIGKFAFRTECINYIYDNYNIEISTWTINRCLWTGRSHDGFQFEFINGLDAYYRDNKDFNNAIKLYNNTDKTIKSISKEIGISYDKTIIYLLAGTSLGLCNYNDSNKKYRKSQRIIDVFDNGNFVGRYLGQKQCANDLNKKYTNKNFNVDSLYVISRKHEKFYYKGLLFIMGNKNDLLSVRSII